MTKEDDREAGGAEGGPLSDLRHGESLDLKALSALSYVLNIALEGARLQKIRDPERGSIALKLRVPGQSYYLTLKSSPDGASICLLYTSPSPRDRQKSRMPSSA